MRRRAPGLPPGAAPPLQPGGNGPSRPPRLAVPLPAHQQQGGGQYARVDILCPPKPQALSPGFNTGLDTATADMLAGLNTQSGSNFNMKLHRHSSSQLNKEPGHGTAVPPPSAMPARRATVDGHYRKRMPPRVKKTSPPPTSYEPHQRYTTGNDGTDPPLRHVTC